MAKNTNNAHKVEQGGTSGVTGNETVAVKHDVAGLIATMGSKAAVIRHLSGLGLKTNDINKAFNDAGVKMRYQHVRNVLNQPLKKASA